jgi:hypothetical protein
MMKSNVPLADRITAAIQANDTQSGRVPMGKGPQFQPARTYFSPTDSYEDNIGPDFGVHNFHQGSMRGMWSIAEQQQASVPVTAITKSGNTANNQLAAIQGGIPQNPQAPPGAWSGIPQMVTSIRTTGPVLINGNVTLHSSVSNDSIGLAIYRDGQLVGNHTSHTMPAGLPENMQISITDNPPTGQHVYAMYWSPGSGTLTANSNERNFSVLNLSPQG